MLLSGSNVASLLRPDLTEDQWMRLDPTMARPASSTLETQTIPEAPPAPGGFSRRDVLGAAAAGAAAFTMLPTAGRAQAAESAAAGAGKFRGGLLCCCPDRARRRAHQICATSAAPSAVSEHSQRAGRARWALARQRGPLTRFDLDTPQAATPIRRSSLRSHTAAALQRRP